MSISKKKIIVQCMAGSDINDCIREAICLAVTEQVDVEFKFNQHTYTVNPRDIYISVISSRRVINETD